MIQETLMLFKYKISELLCERLNYRSANIYCPHQDAMEIVDFPSPDW